MCKIEKIIKNLSGAWGKIVERNHISEKDILGKYEWQQHKSWFHNECSKLLEQSKQNKFQWLQHES
jgi:hypothetical protein